MGHYLFCRYYGVSATLPFFIPFPTFFGTMGAVILIRSPIRSRTALFDIGIAGPIAGFAMATLMLFLALPFSKLLPAGTSSEIQFGYPLVFQIAWRVLPLAPIHGASAWQAINLHPIAIAAWVGMFATSLNLLPGGQLDGGHIVFSLSPRAHKLVSNLSIVVLIAMAFYFWLGWMIWAILLRITGMRHPMVAEWPGVTGLRRWIAGFGLVMLVVTLSPVPIGPHGSLREFLPVVKEGLRELVTWIASLPRLNTLLNSSEQISLLLDPAGSHPGGQMVHLLAPAQAYMRLEERPQRRLAGVRFERVNLGF